MAETDDLSEPVTAATVGVLLHPDEDAELMTGVPFLPSLEPDPGPEPSGVLEGPQADAEVPEPWSDATPEQEVRSEAEARAAIEFADALTEVACRIVAERSGISEARLPKGLNAAITELDQLLASREWTT
jgi:hypothetical protein